MPQIGDIIDSRWRIVDELSRDSGQGDTYLVEDNKEDTTGKRYVIKLLKVQDEKTVARFENEIRSCLALQHPNIVKVKASAYKDTATPYLVTEYCLGGELTTKKIGKLSLLQRLRMFQSICEAITHAHSKKVIHRDIKPRNIFFKTLKSLTPIVGDFGLCFFKDEDGGVRLTGTREAWGAWEFRPPEADIGRVESCAESADVYMLGKLLYWFLSGGDHLVREYYVRPQFDLRKKNAAHVVYASYEVMARSITEEPEQRYQTAGEMLEDIKGLVSFAQNDARYLDCDLDQSCVFCRVGKYHWRIIPRIYDSKFNYQASRFYGLTFELEAHDTNVSTHPRILFAICDRCGNLQQFRLDEELKLSSSWENQPEP